MNQSINESIKFYLNSDKSHPEASHSALLSQDSTKWTQVETAFTKNSSVGRNLEQIRPPDGAHLLFDQLSWERKSKNWGERGRQIEVGDRGGVVKKELKRGTDGQTDGNTRNRSELDVQKKFCSIITTWWISYKRSWS